MKIFKKSPKTRYNEELRGGSVNKVNAYMYNTYVKNPKIVIQNNMLQYGQIYTYTYNPKYKDVLAFYDKNPLVLIYNQYYNKNTNNILYSGINLHFLPIEEKMILLDTYWHYFYKFNGTKLIKVLPVTYSEFFKFAFTRLRKINYKFALRTYIINRLNKATLINEDEWGKIIMAKPNFIEKLSIEEIYKLYYKAK